MHRYLVIELKDSEFMPEYIGKLNFYWMIYFAAKVIIALLVFCSAKPKIVLKLNMPCVIFKNR